MRSILYLHGFHSSPMSEKATIFKRFVQEHHSDIEVIAPQLAVHPQPAIAQITDLVEQHKESLIGVVGSSLGGYLSTYLHNEFNLPAVVINPAVKPFELLSAYLGKQVQPVTGEEYELAEHHMMELKTAYQSTVRVPDKVWLLQQEKDEVLDFQQALDHYQGCKVTFELGGNHAFVGFDRFPAQIVEFLVTHSFSSQ